MCTHRLTSIRRQTEQQAAQTWPRQSLTSYIPPPNQKELAHPELFPALAHIRRTPPAALPVLIVEEAGLNFWHLQDRVFRMPRAAVFVKLATPEVIERTKGEGKGRKRMVQASKSDHASPPAPPLSHTKIPSRLSYLHSTPFLHTTNTPHTTHKTGVRLPAARGADGAAGPPCEGLAQRDHLPGTCISLLISV